MWLKDYPLVRKWVYGVAVALMPLLVYYGYVAEEVAPVYVSVVGAVLVPALAYRNTDSSGGAGAPSEPENAELTK